MRIFPLLALLTLAALSGIKPLAAQCMPEMLISTYNDGDISQDGATVFAFASTVDDSTLCSCYHYNYATTIVLGLPGGTDLYNTESGDSSSVSASTDGVEGTYTASGVTTLTCSCYGNLGASGGTIPISPPPPEITGIADTATWSNTIYQGASGYLAIFGDGLTAWGQTPTPTVTGDGDVTVSLYWASDTQVNVSYTVAAQAAATSHTLTLQTAQGTAHGTVQVVAGACADQRDSIIAEYVTYGVSLSPTCSSFTQSSPTANFTFGTLNSGTYAWAILTNYLGSGLDGIFANEPYAMVITSGYRNPAKEYTINAAYVATSRHEYGDAVDIATYNSNTQWTSMHNAARQYGTTGGTPCIEPLTQSTNNHLHVDWRPVAQCAPKWLQ